MSTENFTESHNNLADQAARSADQAIRSTQRMTHQALDGMAGGVQALREQALRATDGTLHYVRQEPVKSMLMAAAVGAALMALLSLMGASRHRG
jgi:ElaB/YqjD/DUF883 family membrane-anchored ribosome-binding protein